MDLAFSGWKNENTDRKCQPCYMAFLRRIMTTGHDIQHLVIIWNLLVSQVILSPVTHLSYWTSSLQGINDHRRNLKLINFLIKKNPFGFTRFYQIFHTEMRPLIQQYMSCHTVSGNHRCAEENFMNEWFIKWWILMRQSLSIMVDEYGNKGFLVRLFSSHAIKVPG